MIIAIEYRFNGFCVSVCVWARARPFWWTSSARCVCVCLLKSFCHALKRSTGTAVLTCKGPLCFATMFGRQFWQFQWECAWLHVRLWVCVCVCVCALAPFSQWARAIPRTMEWCTCAEKFSKRGKTNSSYMCWLYAPSFWYTTTECAMRYVVCVRWPMALRQARYWSDKTGRC